VALGFTANPRATASKALQWLLADDRRLVMGETRDVRRFTKSLIEATSPFWSQSELHDFEKHISAYRPVPPASLEAEDRRYFLNFTRATKAVLLSAVQGHVLSDESREQVDSIKRVFGSDLGVASSVSGGLIGSPMSAAAMQRAKDKDILKIFAELPDSTEWDHPKEWMRGGNIQLSREFANFAKQDPARALEIMKAFQPKQQERAAGYVLDALSEIDQWKGSVESTFLDLVARGFGADEFRSSAAHAIEKLGNGKAAISEATLDVFVSWLQPSESEEVELRERRDDRFESLLWGLGGATILPGGNFPVLSALAAILLAQGENGRDRLIAILRTHLRVERNLNVWQALLMRLSHAGGPNPGVTSEFLRDLFACYPSLLKTREAVLLLAYAQSWDDQLVMDQIEPWSDSDDVLLQQALGELVGVCAITKGSSKWHELLERLLSDRKPRVLLGIAYSASHLWVRREYRMGAGALLCRLVPLSDKLVMRGIVDVFRIVDELRADQATFDLLEVLAHADFSGVSSTFIVEKLQALLPHRSALIGAVAMQLAKAWAPALGDIGTEFAMAAPQLSDLAITLHRIGGDARDLGVTLFELMLDIDARGAQETLNEIDGRFRANGFGLLRPHRPPRRRRKRQAQ
jgi:hypothetical protein